MNHTKPKEPIYYSERNWRNRDEYDTAMKEYWIKLSAYWIAYYQSNPTQEEV